MNGRDSSAIQMKPFDEQTLYELLDLAPDAQQEAIDRAFEKANSFYGPGSLATYTLADPGDARRLLALIEDAYLTLSDRELRRAYDVRLGLANQAAAAAAPAAASAPDTLPAPVAAPLAVATQVPEVTSPVDPSMGAASAAALDAPPILPHAPSPAESATPALSGEPLASPVDAALSVAEAAALPAPAVPPHPPAAVVSEVDGALSAATAASIAAPDVAPHPPASITSEVDAALSAASAASRIAPELPPHPPALPEAPAPRSTLQEVAIVERAPTDEQANVRARVAHAKAENARPELRLVESRPEPKPEPSKLEPKPERLPLMRNPAPQPAPEPPALPKMPELTPATPYSGELLRKVREARGLTIGQLCDRTKINHVHVENVEADRYASLPPDVYLRGFLMSMARELKLDPLKVSKGYLGLVAAAKSKDA